MVAYYGLYWKLHVVLRMCGGDFGYSDGVDGGGVRCGYLILNLCGNSIFYMGILGCLVRCVWGSYLSIGFGMNVRLRVYVLGLRRL